MISEIYLLINSLDIIFHNIIEHKNNMPFLSQLNCKTWIDEFEENNWIIYLDEISFVKSREADSINIWYLKIKLR